MSIPLLDHEYDTEAKTEPSRVIKPRDVPAACVICFFQDVITEVVQEQDARVAVANRWEDGPHPLYEMDVDDRRVAFFHPGVGSAIAAALLEEAIAFGCRKFIVCGGCGILQPDTEVGDLLLVTAAVRDEGVSYHYLPPAREVQANPHAVRVLAETMDQRGLPYRRVKTWTTDAPYRETAAIIARRMGEGCTAVEMEAAALMAVAAFRGVPLGQLLYAGDDLSGVDWDPRGWQKRGDVRRNLFWLAVENALRL